MSLFTDEAVQNAVIPDLTTFMSMFMWKLHSITNTHYMYLFRAWFQIINRFQYISAIPYQVLRYLIRRYRIRHWPYNIDWYHSRYWRYGQLVLILMIDIDDIDTKNHWPIPTSIPITRLLTMVQSKWANRNFKHACTEEKQEF